MTNFEFKSFPYKDLDTQPLGSNWCWASCFINILKICKVENLITPCYLAKSYASFKDNSITISSLEGCCNSSNGKPSNICDKTINVEDLIAFFDSEGLTCKEIVNPLTFIKNTEAVKKHLKEYKIPIIVEVDNGGTSHLVLITGYGHFRSCSYTLFNNPLKSLNDEYINNAVLDNHIRYKPVKAWKCTSFKGLTHRPAIEDDHVFYKNLKNIDDLITPSLRYNLGISSLGFITRSTVDLIHNNDKIYPKSLKAENITSHLRISSSSCKESYLRKTANPTAIKSIIDGLLANEDSIEICPSLEDYFEEYATTIKRRLGNCDLHEVKPISFPTNYDLNKEWMSITDFKKKLSEQPKIKFIN